MDQLANCVCAGLLTDTAKAKAIYTSMDADLKNEFGRPKSTESATAYVASIHNKAQAFRQKLSLADECTS